MQLYTYAAAPDMNSRYSFGVYDGDTADMIFDVGFRITTAHRVRLLGVNTAELRTTTRELGLQHKALTLNWIKSAVAHSDSKFPLIIQTAKSDSFGRYLATVYSKQTAVSLNDYLLQNGVPPYVKK